MILAFFLPRLLSSSPSFFLSWVDISAASGYSNQVMSTAANTRIRNLSQRHIEPEMNTNREINARVDRGIRDQDRRSARRSNRKPRSAWLSMFEGL